ncbi:OsmC family protein [Paludicola sp. MB14-C6]|uniref:OsmC family protein n=1 Tax=Paludihabitans sp. MB14-C6 TaxID=3070656 RepID=UPI0027DADF96|nr:OsmC family protein [Paludicola sp. MB14-C6]WMJ22724.1 OsmC family protein [Paludicola sp. MB14-C6]
MLTTFKATAKKLPDGLQVETNARGFKIIMDEPEDLGGTDTAMNPVEAVLCALGACQTIVASAFAPAHDFTFEEFHVELEGDLDPDGFMGLADVRNGFQEIRFVMHFKTNEPREKVESFAKFIENTCPVGDCLSNGVKLVMSGVAID